jgi:catechol 2,3-dioxygenase-like lactoylglutathione lyase family enzyme
MFDNRFSRFNRRETLTMLGAFAVKSAIGAPDSPLHYSGLDHLAIAASDTERSVAFYSRIFGHDVLKDSRSPRRYFKIGNGYIAIAPPAQGQGAKRVDHICAGIAGFSQAGAKSYLDDRDIPSRETNVGRYVTDPDGIQVQLWTENSWKALNNASPEAASGAEAPVFRPLGLDHILLRVSDMEKSAAFYQKVFGAEPQRSASPVRIWFQIGSGRLGLSPVGAGPGVDHFCLAVASYDRGGVAKMLQGHGVRIEPGESPGALMFRDLDGILVQVTSPRGAAK